MKLLYVTNRIDGSGGLERVLSIKTDALIGLGYEVHVLTLNQNSFDLFYEFNSKIVYHNIKAKGNPLTYYNQYKQGIRGTIEKISPQIILVCDDGLKGLLLPLLIGKPCPMIYERHASKSIFKNQDSSSILKRIKFYLQNWLMDFGAKKFDAFVVLTQSNTDEWDTNNLKVIPNPLPFKPLKKSSLLNKKVITVGSHGFQKGYDRLLKAWKVVSKKHPDWKLDIYGKIDTEQTYIKLAERLGLKKSVSFYEPVKNISDKYSEASIYVMPSRSEGFGMVLIEAMAHGLPCISFDCPSGPKDIIKHGEDGYLVENGNIEQFSNKILTLIEHTDLRGYMGKNADINVQRYLPENVIKEWDTLFKQLVKA